MRPPTLRTSWSHCTTCAPRRRRRPRGGSPRCGLARRARSSTTPRGGRYDLSPYLLPISAWWEVRSAAAAASSTAAAASSTATAPSPAATAPSSAFYTAIASTSDSSASALPAASTASASATSTATATATTGRPSGDAGVAPRREAQAVLVALRLVAPCREELRAAALHARLAGGERAFRLSQDAPPPPSRPGGSTGPGRCKSAWKLARGLSSPPPSGLESC